MDIIRGINKLIIESECGPSYISSDHLRARY